MAAGLDRYPLIHRYGYQLAGLRATWLAIGSPEPDSLHEVCEQDGFT